MVVVVVVGGTVVVGIPSAETIRETVVVVTAVFDCAVVVVVTES